MYRVTEVRPFPLGDIRKSLDIYNRVFGLGLLLKEIPNWLFL